MQKAKLIAHVRPDILVLSGFDHDHGLVALSAFRDLIAEQGHDLAHIFAFPSNSGQRTGRDMTGDSRDDTADDTQGYGHFSGEKALAALSRFPFKHEAARDFSGFLWRDLPNARLSPLTLEILDLQRLSSTGHWDLPLHISRTQRLHLLIYQAGPPVFGGDSSRNLFRNHDETAFWIHFLEGRLPMAPPAAPFALVGGSNLDPFDGHGLNAAINALLQHPSLQDPKPSSQGALLAAMDGVSANHLGPHGLDTVHWPQTPGPGNLRVSYILPAVGLRVIDAGVFWPEPADPEVEFLGDVEDPPTRHRMIWVDLDPASIAPVPN